MRVCSPELGIDPEANLGGAVYDRELLTALADEGVELSILLPEGEPAPEVAGWEITRTPRHKRSYYEYNWIFYRALVETFRRRPFDVLRVHSPYSVGPGALLFAARAGVPTVLHYLHVEPRALWRAVDRVTLARYSHIVAISDATRDQLVTTYGLEPKTVTVARPGVASRFTPAAADPGLRARWGDAAVMVFIGSLIARKNVGTVLRALAILESRGENLRFVIAGTGPDEPALRQEAGALSVAHRVEFLGRVSEAHKIVLLRTADLFVFPSLLEGFGMAPAEAMACGLPVVAFASGPVREFIADRVSGLLVDPGAGAEAFADAIALVLHDERLRQTVRAGGLAQSARLSWRNSAQQVARTYQDVIRAA